MSSKKLTKLQKNILDCLAKNMTTKEIMQELNCSESSVKQVRANEGLNKLHGQDFESKFISVVSKAIDKTEEAMQNTNLRPDEIIVLSRTLIDFKKIKEEVKPREDININIRYV